METHKRSIAKAVSWRLTGTVDTILISWIITGQFVLAASIGLFELMTKTLLYYLHERAWQKAKWGQIDPNTVSDKGDGI
ncbi:MAG: hypothetical protein A2283_19110 [Lentisphaerae bacterium RIFOXYA12_FULL_48_11]|nr:MAG: hypothetical protein A2283_19110 [Lentisphaerae bacterium RIFOXYA12_FULL_48_11]